MHVDDVGRERPNGFVVEPQPLNGVGSYVVNEHITGRYQALQLCTIIFGLDIPANGALAPVDGHVKLAHSRGLRRAPKDADRVSGGRLDLHDVSSEIGEHLRAIRAED